MGQPVDPYEQPPRDPTPAAYDPVVPASDPALLAPFPSYTAPPGQPPYPSTPAPYAPPVYQYAATSPAAPFGVDTAGQPYSDKSRTAAGMLQLAPGFLFGLGGIGRLYAGNTGLGIAQIIATVVGWASFWCGFALILPFFIFAGVWAWFVIDGIVMLAGSPRDGRGRPLRP